MIPFVKMQGLGNDFVVLDALRGDLPAFDPALVPTLCDRRRGVGGDGALLVERGTDAPFRMRMWNPDGSESEMCGNGLRCAAALLRDRGYAEGAVVDIETGAGVLRASFEAERVTIDMGVARLLPGGSEAGFGVSMGNPHLVVFVDDVDAIDLASEGPRLEAHPDFPQRTNVHFVQILSPGEARVRVWERGAGATLACGTGACAVAVAGVETRRLARRATIHLPGGSLRIEVGDDRRVTMTGPAETVFEGSFGS